MIIVKKQFKMSEMMMQSKMWKKEKSEKGKLKLCRIRRWGARFKPFYAYRKRLHISACYSNGNVMHQLTSIDTY